MADRSAYVEPITGLRALAVLAVMFFHLNDDWMPGGFAGVDMFFVISGFVVAHSVIAMQPESYRDFLVQFYRRRIIRIFPAVLVYVALALCLSVLFIPFTKWTYSIEATGAAAAVGLSNFALMREAGGYFSAAAEYNPFTHTWSLAVEEQFYLLFALIGWPLLIKRDTPAGRVALLAFIFAALASLAYCAFQMGQSQSFAFYMLPTRFWELAAGLLLRLSIDNRNLQHLARTLKPYSEALTTAVLAGLVWTLWSTDGTGFPYPGAILPCALTALAIACIWFWRSTAVSKALSTPVIVWIGLTSYSLYLWHWGVIVFMRWTVGVDYLWQKLIALILTFAISAASYYAVERAVRYSHVIRSWKPGDFFPRCGAAVAAIFALCIAGQAIKPDIGLAWANDLNVWAPYTPPPEARPCMAIMRKNHVGNAQIISFDVPCRKPNARKLFVVGDSHAAAYQRMLWRIAETGDWDVRLYTLNSCGFLNFRDRDRDPDCVSFTEQAMRSIRETAAQGDIVFLPALHTPRFWKKWNAADHYLPTYPILAKRIEENRQRLLVLANIGIEVIVEDAKPVSPIALFRCADWFNRHQPYCQPGTSVARDVELARMKPVRDAIRHVSSDLPNVTVWNPIDILCGDKTCEGYRDGQPLYFDSDHLTAFGNELLLPYFTAKLGQISPAARKRIAVDGESDFPPR